MSDTEVALYNCNTSKKYTAIITDVYAVSINITAAHSLDPADPGAEADGGSDRCSSSSDGTARARPRTAIEFRDCSRNATTAMTPNAARERNGPKRRTSRK